MIVDYGVDHCQYFPGVSTVHTPYSFVYLGAGMSAYEALEQALEYASEYEDTSVIVNDLSKEITVLAGDLDNTDFLELYHYVAVFF